MHLWNYPPQETYPHKESQEKKIDRRSIIENNRRTHTEKIYDIFSNVHRTYLYALIRLPFYFDDDLFFEDDNFCACCPFCAMAVLHHTWSKNPHRNMKYSWSLFSFICSSHHSTYLFTIVHTISLYDYYLSATALCPVSVVKCALYTCTTVQTIIISLVSLTFNTIINAGLIMAFGFFDAADTQTEHHPITSNNRNSSLWTHPEKINLTMPMITVMMTMTIAMMQLTFMCEHTLLLLS